MTRANAIAIENNSLFVLISECGAEMLRIVQKRSHAHLDICSNDAATPSDGGAEGERGAADIERLWCGDPAVWARHAPLLFPLIGRLRDGQYELDGQRIDAPTHGFCRDRVFKAEQLSVTHARFSTSWDDGTLAVYPFRFRLVVDYELCGSTIVKTHRIENAGDAPMPFEVGGHEAYSTRLAPGERMSDWRVRFEGLVGADCIDVYDMDDAGILRLPKRRVPLENGCLTQTPEQLGLDTVVLENVPGSKATLESVRSGHAVEVEFPDFPYLGIWTKALGAGASDEARYLCVEPWSALPDGHFAPREFAEKPGVRVVAPGEQVTLTYRMTFR